MQGLSPVHAHISSRGWKEVLGAMEIGPMTWQEWPWVAALTASTAWKHVSAPLRAEVSPEWVAARVQQSLLGLLGQPGNVALVAREAGRPVGYLVVTFLPDELTGVTTGLFWDIWVEPAWRGRGVATSLTHAGEAHCRAMGVKLIRRYIATDNQPSLHHAVRDGNRPERVMYEKVL